MVDFANRRVGGGVLGRGCVQEEIRFAICPELIVAKLFTANLQDNECLMVTGCEQFSEYSGYSSSFKYVKGFQDNTEKDQFGRRRVQVLVMDAHAFKTYEEQFQTLWIEREVNKAYCGFYEPADQNQEPRCPIATGNWGCGVFKGDPRLKFLLQLMAASQAGRELVYYTAGDKKLQAEFVTMYRILSRRKCTVGQVFQLIGDYYHNEIQRGRSDLSLCDYICKLDQQNSRY